MLLAVDTSTQRIGIALYDGSQFLCEESWLSRQYHTVELANAVRFTPRFSILNQSSTTPGRLQGAFSSISECLQKPSIGGLDISEIPADQRFQERG